MRHELHQEPEIGLDLPSTQHKLLAALDGLPLEITLGRNTTSIGAVLRGTGGNADDRPVVLLRADMDALPVQERTEVEYKSRVDGAMHACGHDLHMAMLVGAARLLTDRRDRLAGDVLFMFQPGEEGVNGAGVMIDEGILDLAGRRADAAYGMHVFSGLTEHGRFATKPDTLMAASDILAVTVIGSGGHGSAPHLANDPVPAIAEMVTALQAMVTRQFDVFDPVVVSVGLLQAGTACNVIPDTARFEASVRSFSDTARKRMMEAAPRLLAGIAAAHGVEVVVDYRPGYPPTVNDPDETLFAEGVITGLFGADRHQRLAKPMTASEDFSRVLEAVPGAYVFLGAAAPGADPATAAYNHSAFATFDDGVLTDGAALHTTLAAKRLEQFSIPAGRPGRRTKHAVTLEAAR